MGIDETKFQLAGFQKVYDSFWELLFFSGVTVTSALYDIDKDALCPFFTEFSRALKGRPADCQFLWVSYGGF